MDLARGRWVYSHRLVDATLVRTASEFGDLWELSVEVKAPLKIGQHQFTFPSWQDSQDLDFGKPTDRAYYPVIGGVSESMWRMHPNWLGRNYPGGVFAPLVVFANAEQGMLVAQAEWPQKRNLILYGHKRVQFIPFDRPKMGKRNVYRLLTRRFQLPPGSNGAWQTAVLSYQQWLQSKMKLPAPPEWMQKMDGYISYHLQNLGAFGSGIVLDHIKRGFDVFPWVLFWGQMSNGAAPGPEPALLPGEEVGCCLPLISLHSRYKGGFQELIKNWKSLTSNQTAEPRIGIYSRLNPSPSGQYMESVEGRNFLKRWFDFARGLGVNSFYLDEYGRMDYAELNPDVTPYVEPFYNGLIPYDTVIEGFVDVYPRMALLSGGLRGNPPEDPSFVLTNDFEKGGPSDAAKRSIPSLRMARVLMGQRLGTAGYNNGDHVLRETWSAQSPYWAEREVFLLGLKQETSYSSLVGYGGNEMERKIERLRREFDWWSRSPSYLDTYGLTAMPAEIRVRRFVDCKGKTLLTVDNPKRRSGDSVRVDGRTVSLPPEEIGIVELDLS